MAHDVRSSYYDKDAPFDPYAQGHARQSSGYNAASFATPARQAPLKGGRDEEEAFSPEANWDIYNDFNNVGPRLNNTPPAFSSADSKGMYRPLPNRTDARSDATTPEVELVTVPAFGAEWNKDELKGMTKSGKRKAKTQARNDTGACGGCFTRRLLVFVIFGLILATGIALAICIPRVPSFSFNSDSPFRPINNDGDAQWKTAFSRTPANFSFPAWLDLRVNTRSSITPIHFDLLSAKLYEQGEYTVVGTGNLTGYTVPAKKDVPILLPIVFEHQAVNSSDLTWLHFYDACKNSRPGINIRVVLEMKIRGRLGTAGTSTQINGVACPIELPLDSV
ncbi:hypothetical protein BKA62DRAFT_709271 [Auriculariales sp. MPI-PUGE-AT-0066]|nr:hypothetical protein BKA62DRAFT_709271 [Auriculariales sp. MPI-PUGE-AT-0066]